MNDFNSLGYHPGNSLIHSINATIKMVFFLLVSISSMITYDTRYLLIVSLVAIILFKISELKWYQVSFVVKFILFFTIINLVAVYLFDPEYGVRLYGKKTIIWSGFGRFTLTLQELFYLSNLLLKYLCTIPLALVFLLTTNPSNFSASLNKIGVNYKISYAVALALRYIPDIQETYYNISQAQQARGFEMSKKAKLSQRVNGASKIILPLIFSSLERIETISTAMELRQFGQFKKRTWYVEEPLQIRDYITILIAIVFVLAVIILFFVNNGRFYNPWG